jgi:hypothetical protein
VAEAYGLFSGFDPVANAAGNVPAVDALGRQVGGVFARASSLLVWGSTAAVLARRALRLGWRRSWRGPEVLVPGVIAFSSFMLLAGQNYGGEAILRVTLYSTFGCCAVLGPALANAVQRRAWTALAAAAWTAVVVACTAQSSFTLWSVGLMRPEDLAAAQWLVAQHPDATVVPVVADWPGRTAVDYERYVGEYTTLEPGVDDILRKEVPPAQRIDSPSIPLSPALLAEVAQLPPQRPTFFVFTAAMRQSDAYYATFTAGSYQATIDALLTSPQWQLARHQDDVWIFRYRGPGSPPG